ncbi:MAG: hypothetical protein ACYTGH_09525 [Planctomycetota bacterium]
MKKALMLVAGLVLSGMCISCGGQPQPQSAAERHMQESANQMTQSVQDAAQRSATDATAAKANVPGH